MTWRNARGPKIEVAEQQRIGRQSGPEWGQDELFTAMRVNCLRARPAAYT